MSHAYRSAQPDAHPHVVVIGAGFAGLAAVKALSKAPVRVTLVDQNTHHLFQPLLYQVATSLLDPSEIAAPIRALVRGFDNATFLRARALDIDTAHRSVATTEGNLHYDYLVVAAGAVTNFFGNRGLEERAYALKTLDEALGLRNRILESFERAAACDDEVERRRLMSIVIVGAGPTGVELAGGIAELIDQVLRRDLPALDVNEAVVTIVGLSLEVLETFAPSLRDAAHRALTRRGVQLRLRTSVERVDAQGVVLSDGERIEAATVVHAAGVVGAPLAAALPGGMNGRRRVPVQNTLQVPGHPEVFVVGDVAAPLGKDGNVLPQLSPVALQSGRHAGRMIVRLLSGKALADFRYRNKGTMAMIGRLSAVAQIGRIHLRGVIGWTVWLGLHLMYLVRHRSRAVALLTWAVNFVSRDRPVRLITSPTRVDSIESMRPIEEAA